MIFPAIKFHSYMDFPVFSYDFQFFPLFREEFPYIKLHPQWWSHFLRPIGMCLPGCLALRLSALVFGMMFPPGQPSPSRRVAEASRDGVHENGHNEELSLQAAEAPWGPWPCPASWLWKLGAPPIIKLRFSDKALCACVFVFKTSYW